jgi:2-polyprenyl-3-methyl-5-hydroxy-6-metoxy-1,4-benzoquinol methylase
MIYKNKTALIEALIKPSDVVLDVGFWGQGVSHTKENWVHSILKRRAQDVYGLDLDFDKNIMMPHDHYLKGSAEDFDFTPVSFDIIFAGDLIEHLSNPGLFLGAVRKNLKPAGRLIITTPNCFNLFNIVEKFSKGEPTVNHDHTCYFNDKTIKQLLVKNGFTNISFSYIYSLDLTHKESVKKKILNCLYWILSRATPRYLETLVVIAS